MALRIDRQYLVDTLQQMVQINSVNPGLSPDGVGERDMAKYMESQMQAFGMETDVTPLGDKAWNAVGMWKGAGGGRSLLLTGHMDTVGVGAMGDPFSGTICGSRLYGRGSFDMKSGLAAILGAVKALKETGIVLAGDLVVAGAADEEYLSKGSEQLAQDFMVDGVIVAEPSGFHLVRAHKGFVWYEVCVSGKAAHGSDFENGVDAITRMGRFLVALEKLAEAQQNCEPYPLLGPPSLHASMISGGVELSTYPPSCTVKIEWRTVPGQREDQLRAQLQDIVDQLKAEDPTFEAQIKTLFVRHPFQVSENAPIVQSVVRQAEKVLGEKPEMVGMGGWADTGLFEQAGMAALIFGPQGEGAHAELEWAELDSLVNTARSFAGVILDFCGE